MRNTAGPAPPSNPAETSLFDALEAGSPSLTFAITIQTSRDGLQNQDSKTSDDGGTEDDSNPDSGSIAKVELAQLRNLPVAPVDQPVVTPENFSWRKKWLISSLVLSLIYANAIFSSLVSALGTRIESDLTEDFIHSMKGLNLPLSIFNLGNAVGSVLLAPLSERYGRVPVFQSGWMVFIILNAGCGFVTSHSQLFFIRFLAGLAAAGPICLSQPILAEMWGRSGRGTPCCLNSLSVVVGPSIGNLLAGWALERSPWRWTFWGTSLLSLGLQILVVIFVPETNKAKLRAAASPTNLEMSDHQSRQISFVHHQKPQIIHFPHQSKQPKSATHDPKSVKPITLTPAQENSKKLDDHVYRFPRSRFIPLPLWIFFNEPLVFILSVQMGMIYGLFYAVQARVVSLYHHDLNESIHMSCLHVLSMALGAICASKLNTRGLSAICDRLGIVSERVRHRPEYKLRCMIPGILLLPLGSFCFGLITPLNNPWLLPDIGLFFLGAGVIFGFRKAGSYIIDTFGDRAASALTAMHLIRRVESFVVPFVINLTIKSRLKYELIILGASLSSLLIICPMPFLLFLYGHRIRRLPIL